MEKRDGRRRYERSLIDAVMEHASPRKAAGESLSRVAEDLGMSVGNLQRWFWSRREAARAAGGGSKSDSRRPAAVVPQSPLAFVRLEPAASPEGESLEILVAGVAVRVPVGFDGATLSRVLALVKGGEA